MIYASKRSKEEIFNTITHLIGVGFTLATAWFILSPSYNYSWENAFGVTLFLVGMLLMFTASSIYHWGLPGKLKQKLRLFDHIGIYVMIAASYTPVCIGVVGGLLGWSVFFIMWIAAIAGAIYKVTAIGKYPKLSLSLYLLMGWSVVFIAKPVYESLSNRAIFLILTEGLLYTSGTYFYTHDSKRFFHGIWHIFVLLGAISHWIAIWMIVSGY